MKTLCILFFSITLLFIQKVYSQSAATQRVYEGRIVDEKTHAPLDGASVKVLPSLQTAFTNEHGEFIIKEVPANFENILISNIGYKATVISKKEFLSLKGKIALTNQVMQLDSVSISQDGGSQLRTISKLGIQMRGINNSQELLTMVPGLFIGQHAGGGKAEQIFLRGFDLDHGTDINISVDGVPVNMVSHAHGQGYSDLHFVIPELIETIHFNKGPYYAEKGDFATTGYVAFNTKNVLPASSLKIEGGQYNSLRGVAMLNLLPEKVRKKGQSAYIAGESMFSDGYFDHPQDFSRVNLFGRYQGELNSKNTLNISASYFKSSWNASGQIPERAVKDGSISFYGAIDPNEGGQTMRRNINATLVTNLRNGNYLKNQVYITNYDFELYSNFTYFKVDSINGDQIRQKEKRLIYGYNSSFVHTNFLGDKKLTSEAGINLRSDLVHGSELSRTKDRTALISPINHGDIQQLNSAVYLKEALEITPRFSVNTGIRLDMFDFIYKDALNSKTRRSDAMLISPKINFIYQVSRQSQLYLSAGKGFHSNDARVSVLKTAREILPPVYGTDLGWIWKPFASLYLNSALWYMKVNQEFVYVGDEGIVEPSGKTRRFGIDLSARYQPVKWLYLDFDGNYSHGRAIEQPKGENYLPLAPVFVSTGGILYKSEKGLSAGLRYRWMGKRPADETYAVTAKGYFINDLVINYTKPAWEVRLAVTNLLNTRWKETQFETESRLRNEQFPVSEIHFTPGSPFFIKAGFTYFLKY